MKHFSHIPVPQLPGFSVEIWVGLQIELAIRAHEEKIKICRCPLEKDLGSMARDGFAVKVTFSDRP
jgi:hypothetical protein